MDHQHFIDRIIKSVLPVGVKTFVNLAGPDSLNVGRNYSAVSHIPEKIRFCLTKNTLLVKLIETERHMFY
jgi:hypothetical protein